MTETQEAARGHSRFATWLHHTNDVTQRFLSAGANPALINLAGGLPAPETYPSAEIAEIARAVISEHPADCLGYGPVGGLPALRDAMAERLGTDGLRLSRENVLITSGGMQALDLIGKVLVDPGGLIATQFPTYLGAIDAWRPRNPRYRNMSFEGGIDAVACLRDAQFAYAVPNFSNPTGRLVQPDVRGALVEASHQTGSWLVEDDPYGSLHFDGPALPRMIAISARAGNNRPYDGPVVYMGTVSKEIAPGLRIGWVVASPRLINALVAAKQGGDMCTSGLTQRIVLRAMESGLVDRLAPDLVALYRMRRDALIGALDEYLSPWFTWDRPAGGMFVWAVAKDPTTNTDALFLSGLEHGVCMAPSSAFDAEGRYRRAIRLNFTLNAPDMLREGVRRIAQVMQISAAA